MVPCTETDMNESENLPEKITEGKASGKTAGRVLGDLIPTATVGTLIVVILMLVVFSAVSYRNAVEIQEHNNNARAVLSYVITAVKANEANPVTMEERDGMPAVVIHETSTGYEQVIFQADGKVYEAYGLAGLQPDPEDALLIGETDLFELEWAQADPDLLEVRTDAGNSYVRVRAHAE